MISENLLVDVVVDKETHERIKKKTGISVWSGTELMRAVVLLLNLHDTQFENIKAYQSITKRMNEEAETFAKMERPDNVNNPAHYTQGGIECIDAIRASMSADEFAGFLKGNTMKYLWRYRHKGKAAEDLRKSRWYIDRLIEYTEGEKA